MADHRSVVITRLIGGLGNQMFQYAAGRAVAEHGGVPLLLDVSGFQNYELRRYELGGFAISSGIASEEQLAAFPHVPHQKGLWAALQKRLIGSLSRSILREAHYTYDSRIKTVRLPVLLDGYWQSERYFAQIATILRREFTIKAELLNPANVEMLGKIEKAGGQAVSLHVRRGDYVSNPHTAQYHGICTADYYLMAAARIAQHVVNPHFFVFSDDPVWVQANLKLSQMTTLVQVNDAENGLLDMALMRACRHHIIANSSFSWWGAWLNESPDKIVIAPARWFARVGNDTRDLIPSTWIRL